MKQVFPALHNSALSLSLIVAFAGPGFAQEIADTLYTGGAIITMNDEAPFAEAMAVKEGRILAVGQLSEIIRHQSEKTAVFDLSGQTMLPGFVDSHGHVILGGLQALSANLLAPPDGQRDRYSQSARYVAQLDCGERSRGGAY
jgi:predicted amidohydrolase YtcJ